MPKRTKIEGPATPEQIEDALKTHTKPYEQIRLLAIGMATLGIFTREQIGQALKKGRTTIGRWLTTYQHGGIDALLKRNYQGRKPTLQPEDIDALKQVLRDGKFKTAKEIQQWLANECDKKLPLSGVYYWLAKVTGRHKVPRKVHDKQNPQQKEALLEDIVAKLKTLEIPENQPVYIWVEDEHRYGLISNVRRCWTLRGHRITVPYQTKYQWGYIYGAMELTTGTTEFLFAPTVSLSASQVFIEQLVATNEDAIHVIIWDQAGFHQKAELHRLGEQVRVLPIPPYCPELNPMENLWDLVKGEVANTVFSTLEEIETKIESVLSPFWQSVQRVFAFLPDNWLTQGVATFLEQIHSKNQPNFN